MEGAPLKVVRLRDTFLAPPGLHFFLEFQMVVSWHDIRALSPRFQAFGLMATQCSSSTQTLQVCAVKSEFRPSRIFVKALPNTW